jgi:Prokaryotic E2 family E
VTNRDNEIHLVLHDWVFPESYTPDRSSVLIIIPKNYPMAALDMFYTLPFVQRRTGGWPTAADLFPALSDGKIWQRWSRHIAWRQGVDNLRTFVTAVKAEINKGI